MFVLKLTYLKPVEEVDRALDEHRAYLVEHYASGHFLASGRQTPRVGGVILAMAANRSEIESIARRDPFVRKQLADYEITEFAPTMTSEALSSLRS